jgi:murein DD-endopeptidase MepM/ murein hydrolase activator NlpD
MMRVFSRIFLLFMAGIVLIGCTSPPKATSLPAHTHTQTPSPIASPTARQTTTPTQEAIRSTVEERTITPQPQICSPMQGVSLEDLGSHIFNPFDPPRPGSDDPHMVVDFYMTAEGSQMALEGSPVQAVLTGKVAAVIRDRFPYGNAVLVETPLEQAPSRWLESNPIPTVAPTLEVIPALTCPDIQVETEWNPNQRSIYLMYAHLRESPDLQIGDEIICGQTLGEFGNSGNSLNPHLHLEVRVGPAGARFESMAHYDASASAEEMYNYCLWRVNGLFQLIDPASLFEPNP